MQTRACRFGITRWNDRTAGQGGQDDGAESGSDPHPFTLDLRLVELYSENGEGLEERRGTVPCTLLESFG